MKVTKGIKQNNGISYEVVSNDATENIPQNTLQLLIAYGVEIQDNSGRKITDLSKIKVEDNAPQQLKPEDVLKKINIDGIKANCKQQFPDWETIEPGDWSKNTKKFEDDVEVGLYREPLDEDADIAGTYTLQVFWGDDVIYCKTITDLVPAKKESTVRSTADVLKNIADTAPVEEEEEIDFSSVFTNLGLDKARQLIQEKVDSGMSDEDAFNEVFQMEQDLGDIGVSEEEEEIDLYDEDAEEYEEEPEEEVEEDAEDEISSEDTLDDNEEDYEEEAEFEEPEMDEDTATSYALIDRKIELLQELETLPYFTVNQTIKDRKEEILKELKECDDSINAFGVDEYIDESETLTSNTWRLDLEMTLEEEHKNTGDEKAHERLHALQAQPYLDVDNKVSRLYAMLKEQENGQQKIDLIQNYFLWYSRRVFNRESKVSPRPISLKKSAKLDEIRNSSSNWGYAGFVDFFYRGGEHCHFGHALRFVHYIWDLEESDIERYFFGDSITAVADVLANPNVHYYKFGATCAGDFFKLDDESLKLFGITQKAVLDGFEELCDIYESGMSDKIMQYCDELDKIVAETSGHHAMIQVLFDEKEADYKKTDNYLANPRLEYFYQQFRELGIVPPKIMVMELRDSYAYGIAFYYWKSVKNRNWWVRNKADIISSMEISKFKGEYKRYKQIFSYEDNRELMYKLLNLLTGLELEVRDLPSPIDTYLNIYYLYRLAGLYMYGPRSAKTIPEEGVSLIDAFRSLEESGKDRTINRGSDDDYTNFCNALRNAPFVNSSVPNRYYVGDWNGEQTDIFMPQILESYGYTLEYVKAVYTIYTMEKQIDEVLKRFAVDDYTSLLAERYWLGKLEVENGIVNDEGVIVPVVSFDSDSIAAYGNEDFTKAALLLYWVYKCIGSLSYKYSIEFKLPKDITTLKEPIKETKAIIPKIKYFDTKDIEAKYNKDDCYDALTLLPEIQNALSIVEANIEGYLSHNETDNSALLEVKDMIDTVGAFYRAVDNRIATNIDGTDIFDIDGKYAKCIQLDTQIMTNHTVYLRKPYRGFEMAVGKANLVEDEYKALPYFDVELQDTFFIDKLANLFKVEEPASTPVVNTPTPVASVSTTPTVTISSQATTPTELMTVLENSDLSGIKINKWARDNLLKDIIKRKTNPDDLSPKQLGFLAKLYKELTGNEYGGTGIVPIQKTKLSSAEENAINYALQNKTAFVAQYDDRTADIISTVLRYKEYSEKQGKYVEKAVEFKQNNVS